MTRLVERGVNSFQSSSGHLLAELERIDLRLRLSVLKMRSTDSGRSYDDFRGLYISDAEVTDILSGVPLSLDNDAESGLDDLALKSLSDSLQRLETENACRRAESLRQGMELRLHRLCELFDLTEFDLDTILICLLSELNLKYERLYAYLQDDVTKKRPRVDLVLQTLCPSLEERLAAREAFAPRSPLLEHHLLTLDGDPPGTTTPLLARSLKLDERIIGYMLGADEIDARLLAFAQLVKPHVGWGDVILPEDLKLHLRQLLDRMDQGTILYFQGPYGVGKRTTAEAMCGELGIPLIVIDVAALNSGALPYGLATDLAFREGRLQGAALYWDRFDLLQAEDKPSMYSLRPWLEPYPGPVFLSGEVPWQPKGSWSDKPFVYVQFQLPPHDLRLQLWQAHLDDITFSEDELHALANKFRLSGGQIRDAALGARHLAQARNGGNDAVDIGDLYESCRIHSNQKLITLARKVEPKYTWTDIVLPEDQMAQLHQICSQVKYGHIVYGRWNFEGKLAQGGGLNVLFAGPSGTGKTMAAQIIASDLGLDLYKIDLALIVSKYIGETEKNLDRIFKEGRDSNAILLFDEADALFGKRSEVRDSHDRYANIEIAYLLQKMEEYDGVVILTTNLRKNMDEAFARRMHFAVEFPFPEEHDRYRIWLRIFPEEAPLGADADLGFLAKQFKLTGGNIKNIALAAAFLAAEDSSMITMTHLIKATKREYQKLGKLCTEADFGPYFEMTRGG